MFVFTVGLYRSICFFEWASVELFVFAVGFCRTVMLWLT